MMALAQRTKTHTSIKTYTFNKHTQHINTYIYINLHLYKSIHTMIHRPVYTKTLNIDDMSEKLIIHSVCVCVCV